MGLNFWKFDILDKKEKLKDGPTFILDGQLLYAPNERLERLLVLGHATAGLHDGTLLMRALVQKKPVQALDLAKLVLGWVDSTVTKHFLHSEQVNPGVG